MGDILFNKSVAYLNTNPFKHLSTLKYMSLYREKLTISLLEEGNDWAVLITIPTAVLSYDTITYPTAEKAIFLNGTAEKLKLMLLEEIPSCNYLLRLNEDLDLAGLENRFTIEPGKTFISYTCSESEDLTVNKIVKGNTEITEQAIELIQKNGYSENELRKYFENDSVWFGYTLDNILRSVCFAYRNYQNIWEIAGVRTLETERNKGYGRVVVASALQHLLSRGLVPRYEAEIKNSNSLKLAQTLGMKEFLRIKHFLLCPL